MTNKRMWTSFIMILMTLTIISACSSDDSSSNSSGAKNLKVGFSAEPLTLDPHDADDAVSNQANLLIYDKLVTFNEDSEIVPELAEDWKLAEDSKSLTMQLREDVTFQDGEPFNAEAVKKNFERVLDKDRGFSRTSLFADFIEDVVVDDEYQITFEFHTPFSAALNTLAHGAGGIISPKSIDEEDKKPISENPVGVGPYELDDWTPGTEISFTPNEDYWDGAPELDSISINTIPENSSRSIALENGEIDVAYPIGIEDFERMEEDEDITFSLTPAYRTLSFAINVNKEPFKDEKVRQAINYAVDKDSLSEEILKGAAKPLKAPIGSPLGGYSEVGEYEYDPEKAKELLDEAGIEEGSKINLWTPDARYLMDSTVTESVQAYLQDIGFDVNFEQFEWSTYSDLLDDPGEDFDIMVTSWGASTGDVDWGLRPLFSTEGSNNYNEYSNSEVDELLTNGLEEADEEKRIDIYNDAMQIIFDEAPQLFGIEYQTPLAYKSNVHNIYTWGNEYVVLRNATMD